MHTAACVVFLRVKGKEIRLAFAHDVAHSTFPHLQCPVSVQ